MKEYEFDVIVFGAGPAGIAAAVSAAENGMSAALIESRESIGGVMHSCPGMMFGAGYPCKKSIGGFFETFMQRLYRKDPPAAERRVCSLVEFGDEVVYDTDLALAELYEMLEEKKVRLFPSTLVSDVHAADNRIGKVTAVSKAGTVSFRAAYYIDCTGDGDVAVSAGVPFQKGNDQGLMMGATLTFFMENVNWAEVFADKSDPYYTKYAERGIREGRVHPTIPQIYFLKGFRQGSVFFNTVTVTGIDGTDPLSVLEGTNEARRRAIQLARFCKEELPGFQNARLARMGATVGIRETRKLEGVYRLTYDDLVHARKFSDGIVACDNPLDDVFRDEENSIYSHDSALERGKYYTIPFKSLVPKKVENLLFAGRNMSVDAKAFASVRGMPQCMIMGQAAGTASAMAFKKKCTVQEIVPEDVAQELSASGVNSICGRSLA